MPAEAYMATIAREQRAWAALEGHMPGMPEGDAGLWDEWVEAVAHLKLLAALHTDMDETISPPGPDYLSWRRHRK